MHGKHLTHLTTYGIRTTNFLIHKKLAINNLNIRSTQNPKGREAI